MADLLFFQDLFTDNTKMPKNRLPAQPLWRTITIKGTSSTFTENGNNDDRKRKRCEENKIVRNFKDIVCSDETCEKCQMFSRRYSSGLKGRRPFWLLNPPSRGGS